MSETFTIEGSLELERALTELADQPAMRRAVRAALREAAEPMVVTAQALAPVDKADLRQSIKMATAKRSRSDDGDAFGIVIGIDSSVQPAVYVPRKTGKGGHYRDPGVAGVSVIKEFGTPNDPASPFLRPAWDQHSGGLSVRFGEAVFPAIAREAERLAKKRS